MGWGTSENEDGAIYSYHARGGVMNDATVFHVGGESGSEAIMPLHDGPDTLKKRHEDIKATSARPMNVQVFIGGKELKKDMVVIVDEHVVARNKRGLTTERTNY